MDTLIAITTCIGGCGARQGEDDIPPRWLHPQQQQHQQQQVNYGGNYYDNNYDNNYGGDYGSPYDSADYSGTYTAGNYNDARFPQCNCVIEKSESACPHKEGDKDKDGLENIPATATRVVALLLSAASREAVDADAQIVAIKTKIKAEMQADRPPVYRSTASAAWNPQWKQGLAEAVLERLVDAVRALIPPEAERSEESEREDNGGEDDGERNEGKDRTAAIVEWARKTAASVFAWAEDHPRLVTCLAFAAAVAVLWVLAPWILEVLGFGELGPVADSIAARLQMRYLGTVPKGSWFSFFQRLGMVWKH